MKAIDSNDPQLFSRIVDYSQKLSSRNDKQNAASEEVISNEFPTLMNGESSSEFVKAAVDEVKSNPSSSLPMRVAVAKAMIATKVGSGADASSLVLDSKMEVMRCVTVESCREALAFMESIGKGEKERLKMAIMIRYPFAKDF